MTDRERLLEILNVPIYPHENVDPLEAVADYLLDNDVTFQKWIPVTERLPVITEAQQQRIEEISYLLAPEFNVIIKGATKATTLYCDAEGNWFDMDGTCYTVTNWMPLPEPPKEE